MALSTKTLDALNDSRKTEPHKYIWGQFTPDKEGVGYSDLPEQTNIPDNAKLVLDVNGPSLVTASVKDLKNGISESIATTEKAGIVKPDGTTISVSSDGTISSSGATKAELQDKVSKAGDTMTGPLKMSGESEIRFGTDDNYYYLKHNNAGNFDFNIIKDGKIYGVFLDKQDNYALHYRKDQEFYRLLTTADLENGVLGTISQFTHGTHTNGQPYFIIKFTNGLIIQGIKAVGNATTNWPTPFSTQVLSVLFGDTPLVDNEGSAITGWTLTNVSNSQKYGRRSPFIVGIGI